MSKILMLLLCALLLTVTYCDTDYTAVVTDLSNKIKQDPYKHSAWNRLAYLTDTYGPRMWGSAVLEMAIKDMESQANQIKF